MLSGVFWRGEELAAGRVVVRETKNPLPVFARSRYKFMTWRWFSPRGLGSQILFDIYRSRVLIWVPGEGAG